MSLRKDKKYRYAVTQEYVTDEETGKEKQHYVMWGTITADMVFIPGLHYKLASKETREKLIFPKDWDLSQTLPITGKDAVPYPNGNEDQDPTENNTNKKNAETSNEKEQQYQKPVENGAPNPIETQDRCALADVHRYDTRLYGAVWMFEQLADNCGLLDDLILTLGMNIIVANEILALAVYPYIGRKSYSRFARWQSVYKTQVSILMTAPYMIHPPKVHF